jgi:hypothetical protein
MWGKLCASSEFYKNQMPRNYCSYILYLSGDLIACKDSYPSSLANNGSKLSKSPL